MSSGGKSNNGIDVMSFTHGNVSQGGGSLTALGVFFILSWLLTHLQAGLQR